MTVYLCYVYVGAHDTPHLTTVSCNDDHDLHASIQDLVRLWPRLRLVEAFEDDRLAGRFLFDEPTQRSHPTGASEETAQPS